MNADKSVLLQKQVRDNSEELRTYLNDLVLWEKEMKRKESALNDEKDDEDLKELLSKKKLPKTTKTSVITDDVKKSKKRISGSDYAAWEKFDVDRECEKVDKGKESESSDNETSALEEHNKILQQESLQQKEEGNEFVRQMKWKEAIACYTHAIACYPKDPIYFANRALCFLKKNDFHHAEADCTSALQLNPNYVKALQRRAAARVALNQRREAINDLECVLKLEPHNTQSRNELQKLCGTSKTVKKINTTQISEIKKSSIPPPAIPSTSKYIPEEVTQLPAIPSTSKYIPDPVTQLPAIPSTSKYIPGPVTLSPGPDRKIIPWPERKTATLLTPVEKPAHLRSKNPLRKIEIKEITSKCIETKPELNKNTDILNPERDLNKKLEISVTNIDYSSSNALATILSQSSNLDVDEMLNDIYSSKEPAACTKKVEQINNHEEKKNLSSNEVDTKKLLIDMETNLETFDFPVPKSSVQFYANWKMMRNSSKQKYLYLAKIKAADLPKIFQQYLESDILSDIINVMVEWFIPMELDVYSYLLALSNTGRFAALVMFLSNKDKSALNNLFDYCSTKNIPEEKISALRKVYEL